jgi:hypothetical protein
MSTKLLIKNPISIARLFVLIYFINIIIYPSPCGANARKSFHKHQAMFFKFFLKFRKITKGETFFLSPRMAEFMCLLGVFVAKFPKTIS